MKKIIYIIIVILILSFFVFNNNKQLIPEESIRFRIIANSNETSDQALKMNIKRELDREFFSKIQKAKTKEEADKLIKENQYIINNTLDKYKIPYTINYGKNYFPEKEYNDVTYNEGYYDSLVISLGEAKGDNWWCVMYPPLCLLDNETEEEPEYGFYLEKIISNFTS